MWYRRALMDEDPSILGLGRRARWIAVLATGVLTGALVRLAWDRGIMVNFFLAVKVVVLALWKMLCDFAAAWGEFLQFVLHQRH